MNPQLLADAVVLLHFAFILFVIGGGFLALKWRWIAYIHLPAVVWGVIIEFTGWICPLTPLEQSLRSRAGDLGYQGGFIEHYLLSVIYPDGLTHTIQIVLGFAALLLNAAIYLWFWKMHRQTDDSAPHRRTSPFASSSGHRR